MNHPTSDYYTAMTEADEAMDDALAAIRAEEDAGRLAPVEAAAERIAVLERHVSECRRLRDEHHLGGGT